MALINSGNPALSEKRFRDTILDDVVAQVDTMTAKGTLNKFGVLVLVMLGGAYYSWTEAVKGGNAWTLVLIGVFGGLALGIVMAVKKQWSPYLAPVYAFLEGLFVGAISAFFEYQFSSRQGGYSGGYSGIVLQAVGLTFSVVGVMFLLYKFKIVQATPLFKKVILMASLAIGLFYLVCFIITLSGGDRPGFLFQGTPLGIGFSVFVVALASLKLIVDFDLIDKGVEMGAPKYMEWYSAFGLLVTIVWLYMEILRLLAKLNRK